MKRLVRYLRQPLFVLLSLVVLELWGGGRPAHADLISEVRTLARSGQAEAARQRIESHRAAYGTTPELLAAMSWQARELLARKEYTEAQHAAEVTYEQAVAALKKNPLDSEPHLPIAVGAALEVQAQALAARGESGKAVALLRDALARYEKSSLVPRIQKNINLLTLEGKPAPALDSPRYLGPKPPPLASLKGKALLLFFWAHWCSDCKTAALVVARLRRELGDKGLVVVAPTQPYGFVAGGQEASLEAEITYIDEVRKRHYGDLLDVPAPISAANFRTYGASTTPTLVLVDRGGQVTLYHPGRMTYEELRPRIEAALR